MSTALEDLPELGPGPGVVSVWFGPVTGDPWFAVEGDTPHYAASTMKLALVLAAHRAEDDGQLDLDTAVPVHDDFGSATRSGRFRMQQDYDNDDQPWERLGGTATLRWLASRAIVRSSNLATNLLLEHVGVDRVRRALADVGATHSTFSRGIEDADAAAAGLDNTTTAHDLARTLQALHAGTAASPASCRAVLAMLSAQEHRDTLPAGLPDGVPVAHKSGWVDGVAHDAGIVTPPGEEPFVLVVCSTTERDQQQGNELIARVAAAAWQDRKEHQ